MNEVELFGRIECSDHKIYCFGTEIEDRQEIISGEGETEHVNWYYGYDAFADNRLVPNLKVIIPLINSGVKNWVIEDHAPSFIDREHEFKVKINYFE